MKSLPAAMDKAASAIPGERDSDSHERSVMDEGTRTRQPTSSSIDSFAIYDENSAWERANQDTQKMALEEEIATIGDIENF